MFRLARRSSAFLMVLLLLPAAVYAQTITVTGETPIVDVQSVRVQQTVSKDIIAAIPNSRSLSGIQSLIPGMSSSGDSGGIGGGVGTPRAFTAVAPPILKS